MQRLTAAPSLKVPPLVDPLKRALTQREEERRIMLGAEPQPAQLRPIDPLLWGKPIAAVHLGTDSGAGRAASAPEGLGRPRHAGSQVLMDHFTFPVRQSCEVAVSAVLLTQAAASLFSTRQTGPEVVSQMMPRPKRSLETIKALQLTKPRPAMAMPQ